MVFAMAGSVFAAEKVTAEDARKTALDAAGLKEEQVIFKTAGKTMDDGMEHEYAIGAADGWILERSAEAMDMDD